MERKENRIAITKELKDALGNYLSYQAYRDVAVLMTELDKSPVVEITFKDNGQTQDQSSGPSSPSMFEQQPS